MRAPRLALGAVLAVAIAAAAAGCLKRTAYSACKTADDCAAAGAGAHCEADGACSVDDTACPSGRRYASSAPQPGTCVAGGAPDAPPAADAPPIDGGLPPGRECVQGSPLPPSYSACASQVDQAYPRCGTEAWTELCVHLVEQKCARACSGLAFVGGVTYGVVIDTASHQVLWSDGAFGDDETHAGAWADYDNDGDADLATVGSQQIHILRNDGLTSSLDLTAVYNVSWSAISPGTTYLIGHTVAWVDWNHDGKLDLAVGGNDGLALIANLGNDQFGDVRLLLHTPAATDPDAQPSPPYVYAMAWGDADGDGDEDVAVGFGNDDAAFFVNDGHGGFTRSAWAPPHNQAEEMHWCNLDSDPALELVVAGDNYVDLYDNSGGLPVGAPQLITLDPGGTPASVACADLDGDGDLDLFVGGWTTPPRVYKNGANQLTSIAEVWHDPTVANAMPQGWGAALGDLDGDGKLDALIAGHAYDRPLHLQAYTNATSGTPPAITFTVPAPVDVTAVDIQARHLALAPRP